MVLVLFLVFAWLCIYVFAALPRKLPLAVNLMLFMAIDVILTNKLTIVGFNLKLFRINTASVPHFLSLIVHNDFTVTFVLLIFANVFLTTTSANIRWAIALGAFLFQAFIGSMLRWTGALADRGWSLAMESATIAAVMLFTLLAGMLFRHMAAKEGWVR